MAARNKRDKTESMLTGWATIQINNSLVWQRSAVPGYEHKSLQLRGKLNGLKEWNDGNKELKAISNSVVIEFKDQRGSCAMFCDTEEEKDKLLGVLHYTAEL
ncbi:uncharacterized protein EV420DRAFT_1642776 [Desarmillaria tabescens]|uniref:Uncharacterized protein n=1 Tax=Armillaria tabescens TaxID=1929756 RepID=A0AA39KC41_ARMTA|nr:uncharacterized protein EV420DRAFT_1642776 [Desarmillaria tabescens]KAK0458429.1 hypothetical protein EV420DRAFT_1642776 [Desarmillaria tabescens]